MKKTILQIILLVFFLSVCVGGYLAVGHVLELPFRQTNDTLHKKDAPVNLDFLIPGGTYLDEEVTVGEVLQVRLRKETSLYERIVRTLADVIPEPYGYVADLVLFLFWTFSFMAFFRIFTFMGYGRAIRISLLLGGCVYYFMPDFTPGRMEDVLFIAAPLAIIALRAAIHRRGRKKKTLVA
jgi:hypothetical protein